MYIFFLNLGIEGQSMEVSNIVNIRNVHNREIVMRISSKINNQNRYYTDLNGYQVIFSKITVMNVFICHLCGICGGYICSCMECVILCRIIAQLILSHL
jgi:hypothetical protein